MSRSADSAHRRTRRRTRADGGFTLIEVMVAIGIVGMVMMAVLPQLVVGIRATSTASRVSQAKGVVQGQLDHMRNLPFYIARAAGPYRDVMDTYFPDVAAPTTTPTCRTNGEYTTPATGWTGYVAGAARCDYEPAVGPFFRYVKPADSQGFIVVVNTQFLSGSTPPTPITPGSAYDHDESGRDRPPASQIGVTVNAFYAERGVLKPVYGYTQVADQPVAIKLVDAAANAVAVEIRSETPTKGALSLSGGMLSLTGSLTYASNAAATLAGASAGAATGDEARGAAASVAAPPAVAATSAVAAAMGLVTDRCGLACWGPTRVDVGPVSAAEGLPNVGSPNLPMQALLTDGTDKGLSFHNEEAAADGSRHYRDTLKLAAGAPLVSVDMSGSAVASGVGAACTEGSSATPAYVAASGYLRTTSAQTFPEQLAVEACARARSSTVKLFPTGFAPDGVVQVELQAASSRCYVSGTAHTASVANGFSARVRYRDPSSSSPDGYTSVVVAPTNTTDPLHSVPLTTLVGGNGMTLGDYIASWSSLTGADVESRQAAGVASVSIPGVVTVLSRPVRTGTVPLTPSSSELVDPLSAVSVTVGTVGCRAEDFR